MIIRHGDLDRIAEALEDCDARLLAWLDEAARLRQVVVMMHNMLDPLTVVIGGVLPRPVSPASSCCHAASASTNRAAARA